EPLKLDLASLQARVQDLTATLAVLQPQATTDAEKFREGIFDRYGFTQYARAFIRIHSTIEVGAGSTTTGGGGWTPWNHTVRLLSPSHEAAVHELSHVWHHYLRQDDPGTYRYSLVRGLVHFANDRAWAGTELQKFFRVYVYGDPATGFPGMLPGVKDVWNITEEEWDTKVIDAEVYAGIASWCMLKYREGLRALPPEMWGFYERLGGGITEAPAYYEGGPA
ncbi:MAG: hypothetical protein Q8O76_12355, partial [Chloroflexota bacterium]|nr:hypothetical protein [Chloroflexota bacterium]